MGILTDIATIGDTPALTEEAIIDLLRGLFASSAKIRDSQLDAYVWTSNSATSKILITTANKFDLQNSGMSAGIAVKRGDAVKKTIGQFGGRVKISGTTETRSFLVICPFSIRCYSSNTDAEADHLANEVFIRLAEIEPHIADYYNFKKFQVMGCGTPQRSNIIQGWVATVLVRSISEMVSTLDTDLLPASLGTSYDY